MERLAELEFHLLFWVQGHIKTKHLISHLFLHENSRIWVQKYQKIRAHVVGVFSSHNIQFVVSENSNIVSYSFHAILGQATTIQELH